MYYPYLTNSNKKSTSPVMTKISSVGPREKIGCFGNRGEELRREVFHLDAQPRHWNRPPLFYQNKPNTHNGTKVSEPDTTSSECCTVVFMLLFSEILAMLDTEPSSRHRKPFLSSEPESVAFGAVPRPLHQRQRPNLLQEQQWHPHFHSSR
jgi:hypothetical protein